MIKKLTIFSLLFSILLMSSLAGAGDVIYKSLGQAIKEGNSYHESSSLYVRGKVLSGLVLDRPTDDISNDILLTNVSPLQIKSTNSIYSAGGCFMMARFKGFAGSQPIFHLMRVSCTNENGFNHEFEAGQGGYLGDIVGSEKNKPIRLGEDHGNKSIESGTDVAIRLNREL